MFTYKGINATDMHLRVLNDVTFTSPRRDVTQIQVPGRHGSIIMDNGRFESVNRTIPCRLEVPEELHAEEVISQINQWLIDEGEYHDFLWSNDTDFIYRAKVQGSVVSQRLLPRYGKTVVEFNFHPIKYLRSSLSERQIQSGINLANPFKVDAKPVIRIVGNGNIRIAFGARLLVLQNIGGGCIIDSENQTITDLTGKVTLFDRMYSGFPILKSGNNVISFGSDIQVFITPRLGVLL